MQMKIVGRGGSATGSTLLVALLAVIVLSITVSSFLYTVSNDNRLAGRLQGWSAAMPVAEAGIEEALTQLYYINGLGNLSSNGWSLGMDGLYHKTRALDAPGRYEVSIEPVEPPVIVSIGYAWAPGKLNNGLVGRRLRVTTAKLKTNGGGLTARNQIRFIGGGSLDSFDSSDPNYSTGGKYDPARRKDNGVAQTNSKLSDAIRVDAAKIYGMAATGPGGTIVCGSGAVGDAGWNSSHSWIQPGHARNDSNLDFPDNSLPGTIGLPPLPGIINGTNYTYVLNTGLNYYFPSINISGGQSMLVSGNAVLYVGGNFTTSGSGYIYIAPGASLKLYIGGAATISGIGIINDNQNAASCSIFGLNTCATVSYSAVSTLYGTVNCPRAAFSLSGTAACGSIVADSITISGGSAVHYDESLATSGRGYVVLTWNEIPMGPQ